MRKTGVRHGARRGLLLTAFVTVALLATLLGALAAQAAPLWSPAVLTLAPAATQYTLDVTWKGDGRVTVDPDKTLYDEDEVVTLTAVPDSGRRFAGWSGDVHGTDLQVTLVMDGDKQAGAEFVLDGYTITVTAGAGGSVSPMPPHNPYPSGSSETFAFTPDPGFRVGDVVVDGESAGPVTEYTYDSITHDSTLEVRFEQGPFRITPVQAAGGTISPAEVVSVDPGGSCAFTMKADAGYTLRDVLVDGLSAGADNPFRFFDVHDDHTIQPVFSRARFSVSSWVTGGHGSISPAGKVTYNGGDRPVYRFTPESGYKVDTVVVDDVPVADPTTTYTFAPLAADHRIYVTFVRDQWFTITASAGANGTIKPAGRILVEPGKSQTFTFQPASSFVVDGVYVDGTRVGNQTSYTFFNVQANHTISVTFKPVSFVIRASAGPNGAISPSGSRTVAYGGSQTFTFLPGNGYLVDTFMVDTSRYSARPDYTFSNVRSDHSISVSFRTMSVTVDSPKTVTWKVNGSYSINWHVSPVASKGSFTLVAKDTAGGGWMQLAKVDATGSSAYSKAYQCKLAVGHRYNIIVCYGNYPSPSTGTSGLVTVSN